MLKFSHDEVVGPFRLKIRPNGMYQIHSPQGAFEGPQQKIFRKAVELGVESSELTFAHQELVFNNHNCAEFGLFGRFLYTSKEREAA